MTIDRSHLFVQYKWVISGFDLFTGERTALEEWAFNETDARFVASHKLHEIDFIKKATTGLIAVIMPKTNMGNPNLPQCDFDVKKWWDAGR